MTGRHKIETLRRYVEFRRRYGRDLDSPENRRRRRTVKLSRTIWRYQRALDALEASFQ